MGGSLSPARTRTSLFPFLALQVPRPLPQPLLRRGCQALSTSDRGISSSTTSVRAVKLSTPNLQEHTREAYLGKQVLSVPFNVVD